MHPIEKWHKLIKSNDPNKFDELLDENCTFYSPVVFTPIKGKKKKKMYFEDPNASLEGINKGIWNVSVVSLLRELISAIREKRPLNHGSTFEDGLKNQIVVDAVLESTVKRKWIDL